VKANVLGDISNSVNRLKVLLVEDKCKCEAGVNYYYCTACQTSLCADCAIFSHRHHQDFLGHLETFYALKRTDIELEQERLMERLHQLKQLQVTCDQRIHETQHKKRMRTREQLMYLKELEHQLDQETQDKLKKLEIFKQTLLQTAGDVGHKLNEVDRAVKETSPAVFVCCSHDIIDTMQDLEPVKEQPIDSDFNSLSLPPFVNSAFTLDCIDASDVLYSPHLRVGEGVWRAKVYP
jgi:hypothetical protein